MSYTSFDFPHAHFYDDDLREILKKVFELNNDVKNFVSVNAIKYADPIQWDITRQYEKNTVVIDPLTGIAYLSVAPVPSGISLSRPEYWTVVFDLSRFITQGNQNLTSHVEGAGIIYSTFPLNKGDWVVWNSALYKALDDLPAGTAYSPDYNIERVTVEEYIIALNDSIENEVQARQDADGALSDRINDEAQARQDADGALSDRINDEAQARQDADGALSDRIDNEVQARQDADGNLNDLTTTNKSSLVDAINEVNQTGGGAISLIGDLNNLTTTNKSNVVAAINEVASDIYYLNVKSFGALGDGVTDDTIAIQNCIDAATEKSVVLFPEGVYVINGTINIVNNGVMLMGVGIDSIITRTTQSATPVFYVNNGNTQLTEFNAHELHFKDITSGYCFKLVYTFDSELYDCHIDNCYCFARYGDASNNNMNIWSRIHNIIGNVSVQNASFIQMFYNTNGLHVYDCQINSESGLNSKFVDASAFTAIDTLEIRNNLIQRMTNPIIIDNTNAVGEVLQNFFIKGNIIDSCYVSNVTVNATANGIICRIMLENNWFSCVESQSNNLVFTGTDGTITQISIVNNTIVESRLRAILTQGNNVRTIKIIGNTFNGFNVDPGLSAINSAVTISGTSSEIMISDNMFAPSTDAQGSNTYGIFIQTGALNVMVNGNMLIGVSYPLSGTPTAAKGNIPSSIDT